MDSASTRLPRDPETAQCSGSVAESINTRTPRTCATSGEADEKYETTGAPPRNMKRRPTWIPVKRTSWTGIRRRENQTVLWLWRVVGATALGAIGYAVVRVVDDLDQPARLRFPPDRHRPFRQPGCASMFALLGALWTIPAGVAIGFNPRLARIAQPLAQIAAFGSGHGGISGGTAGSDSPGRRSGIRLDRSAAARHAGWYILFSNTSFLQASRLSCCCREPSRRRYPDGDPASGTVPPYRGSGVVRRPVAATDAEVSCDA